MRIIGGEMSGRRFQPPAQMPHTRPTTDIAKEGLFNILQNRIDFTGIRTLDLFGGTGSISYELASRGASDITLVEKDPKMAAYIEKTATVLGIQNLRVLRQDVLRFLGSNGGAPYDFIFAGPPYAMLEIDRLPLLVLDNNFLADDGIFVLEHTPRNHYEESPGFAWKRNYGTTIFTAFRKLPA